jgi:hypothetical protein
MTPQEIVDEFVNSPEIQVQVVNVLDYCARLSAAVAETHGFHEEERAVKTQLDVAANDTKSPFMGQDLWPWVDLQLLQAEIARMGEELGEAIDNIRHNSPPDDKYPQFPGWHVKLGADVIIRIFDTLGKRRINPGEIFVAKTLVNNGRPFKHGKNS